MDLLPKKILNQTPIFLHIFFKSMKILLTLKFKNKIIKKPNGKQILSNFYLVLL